MKTAVPKMLMCFYHVNQCWYILHIYIYVYSLWVMCFPMAMGCLWETHIVGYRIYRVGVKNHPCAHPEIARIGYSYPQLLWQEVLTHSQSPKVYVLLLDLKHSDCLCCLCQDWWIEDCAVWARIACRALSWSTMITGFAQEWQIPTWWNSGDMWWYLIGNNRILLEYYWYIGGILVNYPPEIEHG